MKKEVGVQSLKEILPEVFKKLEKKRDFEKIERLWGLTVGNRADSHTKVAGFKKDILIVNVDNSIWIYELSLRKDKILQLLKKSEDLKSIKDIRFRIGELS